MAAAISSHRPGTVELQRRFCPLPCHFSPAEVEAKNQTNSLWQEDVLCNPATYPSRCAASAISGKRQCRRQNWAFGEVQEGRFVANCRHGVRWKAFAAIDMRPETVVGC